MSDYLVEVLLNELFRDFMECGPNHSKLSWHPRVRPAFSKYIKDLPHIIPDKCYHPQVYVTMDFTHQYVIDEKIPQRDGETKPIEGKRLVSEETITRTCVQLLNFISYYFEYVLSYGKNKNKKQFHDFAAYILRKLAGDEFERSLFINKIMNFFIAQINVTRARNAIGTCSVALRDNPVYSGAGERTLLFMDKAFSILTQVFVPMVPMMIWAKGRLYKDWYFPIFYGYLQRAVPGDTQGFTTITLEGKDELEKARITHEMLHPAFIQVGEPVKQTMFNFFEKPFYGIDHMQIFKSMFLGGVLKYDASQGRVLSIEEIGTKKSDPSKGRYGFNALGTYAEADQENKAYTPVDVAEETKAMHKDSFTLEVALGITKFARNVVSWGYDMTPYRVFNVDTPTTYTSNFSSRLDLLREMSGIVFHELYVDGYGNIQYHPMRNYNYFLLYDIVYPGMTDKKGNQVGLFGDVKAHKHTFPGAQVIGPEELVNSSKSLNVEEMITFLRLTGSPVAKMDIDPAGIGYVGTYTDEFKIARFGRRMRRLNNDFFNYNFDMKDEKGKTSKFFDMAAEVLCNFYNAEFYTRSDTIIFRPELELCLPMYDVATNEVFYVQSISHSITIGGNATTTINGNMGRKADEPAVDLLSYMLSAEVMYKTGGLAITLPDMTTVEGVKAYMDMFLNYIPYKKWHDIIPKKINSFYDFMNKKSKELWEGGSKGKEKKRRKKRSDTKKDETKDPRAEAAKKAQEAIAKFKILNKSKKDPFALTFK